jgi:hypothetical protein
VTILFVGDSTIAPRLAGITIYHLGGEETWKRLMARFVDKADEASETAIAEASFTL